MRLSGESTEHPATLRDLTQAARRALGGEGGDVADGCGDIGSRIDFSCRNRVTLFHRSAGGCALCGLPLVQIGRGRPRETHSQCRPVLYYSNRMFSALARGAWSEEARRRLRSEFWAEINNALNLTKEAA